MHVDGWEALRPVAPATIAAARESLHCAAQLAASLPKTLLDAAPDYAHQAFVWDAALAAMVSQPLGNARRLRVAVRPHDALWLFVDVDSRPDAAPTLLAHAPYHGRTPAQGFALLRETAEALLAQRLPAPLEAAEAGLPAPCAADAPLDGTDTATLAEIARLYANASRVLAAVAAETPGASPVRVWPHHMDIATLITLDPDADAESARSIGVGMQPGDDSYAALYFYITPWPYPDDRHDLPPLDGGGHWHTAGWGGAILTVPAIMDAKNGEAQAAQVVAFLDSAIQGAQKMLRA